MFRFFNKIMSILFHPKVRMLFGIVLLCVLIYFVGGPLLHLEGDQLRNVTLLIGGLALSVLLIYWIYQYFSERRLTGQMKKEAREQAAEAGSDAQQDLKQLEREFERAFDELARIKPGASVFKVNSTDRLPWVVIIGPPGAGKSTALMASGLRFTSLGRRVRGIGGTRNCAWWLAEEAVFLDTAGRYSTQDEDHDEWLGFLNLLRKHRKTRPIDAVVLQIGIDEIVNLSPSDIEEAALGLRQRLDELIQHLQIRFPVFLVFNKIDRLEGFADFFGGLLKNEQGQPWGFALDTANLGNAPLAELFNERFDALAEVLHQRATRRMYDLTTRESRETILTFPMEFARHRESLQLFTEILFEASRHRERPWLTAVHFISAVQEGQILPSVRETTLGDWAIPTAQVQPGRTEHSYFVPGLFKNLVKTAQDAARPSNQALRSMRLTRALTIVALAPFCFGASWYVGTNYLSDSLWLKEVTSAVTGLLSGYGVGGNVVKADRAALFEELSRQQRLESLLTAREPEGLIAGTYTRAASILRSRIDDEWIMPVEKTLDRRLDEGAQWRPGADEKLFADGFLALKADYVLSQQACQGANEEDTRRWMGQYLASVWRAELGDRQADVLAGTAPNDLQDRISYFFAGTQRSRARLDERARDDALRALKDQSSSLQGQVSPEVVFNLIVANTDLTTLEQQVEGELINDPGLKLVFTPQGCQKFLNNANTGKEWWRCLLDINNPPQLDRDITYLNKYSDARYAWLRSLDFKYKITDIGSAAQALSYIDQPLTSELDQIFDTMAGGSLPDRRKRKRASDLVPQTGGMFGWLRGCMRRTETYVQMNESIIMPQVCKQAQERFVVFALALKEDNKGPVPTAYLAYKTAARALRDRLQRIHRSANRNPEALALVLETMNSEGQLYELSKGREELIRLLRDATPAVDPTELDELLTRLEQDIWSQLVNPAAKALQEDWTTAVFQPWSDIKYKASRDKENEAGACNRIKGFLESKLEPWTQDKLALFYLSRNIRSCNVQEFLGSRMPMSSTACTVESAISIARTLDCGAGGGGGGGGGPVIGDPDGFETKGNECPNPIEWVEIDTSEKIYRCINSAGRCLEQANRKSSGESRLVIKRKDQGNNGLVYHRGGNSWGGLVARGDKRGARLEFSLDPGNCKDKMSAIIYLVGGSEGSPGPKSDTRYKGISLPQKITTVTTER